jgi:hypothetical protein
MSSRYIRLHCCGLLIQPPSERFREFWFGDHLAVIPALPRRGRERL